jgi:2-isopropylmalate synthase
VQIQLRHQGRGLHLEGQGNGPLDAACQALSQHLAQLPGLRIDDYQECALSHGANAQAFASVELACDAVPGSRFGVSQNASLIAASLQALIAGVNQLCHAVDAQK